ncbi:MAG: hypothetical protein U5K55_11630 [Aliarcobacter sp.]|nr:hypothetical protein [Aliarcobacter sp.]
MSFLSLNEIEQEKFFYPTVYLSIKSQASKVMPDYNYVHHELKKKKTN